MSFTPAAAAIGTQVFGSVLSAVGSIAAGRATKDAAARERVAKEFEAQQLEINAGQAVAASQREAQEQRRTAQLAFSRALALSAASGAGASDPTAVKILAGIHGEGAYRASVALYQGEDKARQMRMAASGKRYEGAVIEASGKNAAKAGYISAFGTLASSAGSLYAKYGIPDAKTTQDASYTTGGTANDSYIDAGTPLLTPYA